MYNIRKLFEKNDIFVLFPYSIIKIIKRSFTTQNVETTPKDTVRKIQYLNKSIDWIIHQSRWFNFFYKLGTDTLYTCHKQRLYYGHYGVRREIFPERQYMEITLYRLHKVKSSTFDRYDKEVVKERNEHPKTKLEDLDSIKILAPTLNKWYSRDLDVLSFPFSVETLSKIRCTGTKKTFRRFKRTYETHRVHP